MDELLKYLDQIYEEARIKFKDSIRDKKIMDEISANATMKTINQIKEHINGK